MLLGGYVVKHFNLKVRGILKLIIGLNVAVLVLALVFLVRCENVDFAGVTQPAPSPRFDRTPPALDRPPAHAGQHTDEVLAEMGFGAEEISKLRDGKAIA